MIKAPRALKMPQQPQALAKQSHGKPQQIFFKQSSPYGPPPPRYNEWHESLSRTVDRSLAMLEPDISKKNGLIEKIKSSNDIKRLVKDRIIETVEPSNDFLTLLMTLSAFYLENTLT